MTTATLDRSREPQTTVNGAKQQRIASIDALRGFTILVMIFVNDVAGVQGTPAWMQHMNPSTADGMTFVDVVFPAFLFIVGLSIPLALERRLGRGESLRAVSLHIATRTLSLLAIGVYMVNTEVITDAGLLHPTLWTLLMYAGVILVWVSPPRAWNVAPATLTRWRIGGALLLGALAFLYTGSEASGVVAMRPYWWGILGLIGWAYLVASCTYLLVRRNVPALLGGVVVLYGIYAADALGFFSMLSPVTQWVDPGSVAAHGAITLSGVVLGVMLSPQSSLKSHGARIKGALLYGAGLAAVAHLLHMAADVHQMFIINKIYATPPWGLWSAAITAWFLAAAYWLLDARGSRRWSGALELSGQNALLAYIMAPIFYGAFSFAAFALAVPNLYSSLGGSFAVGFPRSVIFAVAVVWLAASLRKRGFFLKL